MVLVNRSLIHSLNANTQSKHSRYDKCILVTPSVLIICANKGLMSGQFFSKLLHNSMWKDSNLNIWLKPYLDFMTMLSTRFQTQTLMKINGNQSNRIVFQTLWWGLKLMENFQIGPKVLYYEEWIKENTWLFTRK